MDSHRRYEIKLPRRSSSGETVSDAVIEEIATELAARFTGAPAGDRGARRFVPPVCWIQRERTTDFLVDVADTAENLRFFTAFKEKLRSRLQEPGIWVTSYPISVV